MHVLVVRIAIGRCRSLGFLVLCLRLFLFSHAYVGFLVVCRNILMQLPLCSCGIVVITVEALANYLKQHPSFRGRLLTEALGIRLTHVYLGVNMVYLVNYLL